MSGSDFIWRNLVEEVVKVLARQLASRLFEEKKRTKETTFNGGLMDHVNREIQRKLSPKEGKDEKPIGLAPFDIEYGDAIALFLKRCEAIKIHRQDAVYSYRDSLFALAEVLKELESRAGSRTGEISRFLSLIESSLGSDDIDVAYVCQQICSKFSEYQRAA